MMYDRFPRLHLSCLRSLTSLGALGQHLASLADFQPDIENYHSGAPPVVQPNRDIFIIVRPKHFIKSFTSYTMDRIVQDASKMGWAYSDNHQVNTTINQKVSNDIHWQRYP